MKRTTLRRRVLLLLVQWFVLVLVALLAATLLSYGPYRRQAASERLTLARAIAQGVDLSLGSALQALGRVAEDLPALDATATTALRGFRFQSVFHREVYLIDGRGTVLAADPPQTIPVPLSSLGDRPAIKALPSHGGASQAAVLVLVQPFKRGTESYCLVAEMDPQRSPLSTALRELHVAEKTEVLITDAAGVVVASSDSRPLFATDPGAALIGERIAARRAYNSDTDRSTLGEAKGAADGQALTVMAPLRYAPWGVVVRQPEDSAYAGYYGLQRGFLLAIGLLALAGALLARGLSRSVVKPLRLLSRQAERLRAGDLATPIGTPGVHEIAVLGETLDEARTRLAATLGSLEGLNKNLEVQVQQRTESLARQYDNLRLLHHVSQISLRKPDVERLVPETLRLIAEHYHLPVAVLVHRPQDAPPTVFIHPSDAVVPWARDGETPPADWQERPIEHRGVRLAELYLPPGATLDAQVMEALEPQLALSLAGARLWKQTVEQDAQRKVLVRRLLDATEEERRRIARELHDEISQLLTVIQLALGQIPGGQPQVSRAQELLSRTQHDVHRIIYDLRPSQIDDLGLPAALEAHARSHLAHHGLAVNVAVDEALRPAPEIAITVFRIFQEIVTNVLRHARAQHVSVELYENAGKLILSVEDDGVGFAVDHRADGVGLVGMRERAGLVGGTLRVDSERGQGTQVVLEVPLKP